MQGKNSKLTIEVPFRSKQRRIGITGGLASGKSSVSYYLQRVKKLPILDADIYAHEALAPDSESTKAVINRYGKKIINFIEGETISINRSFLRSIIFNDKNEKKWLEDLLHPIIIQRIINEIYNLDSKPIIILVLPLLFELKLSKMCSEIWLVDCTYNQQLKRLMNRDKIKKEDAIRMLNSQIPLKQKRKISNIIINNRNNLNEWEEQVDNLL